MKGGAQGLSKLLNDVLLNEGKAYRDKENCLMMFFWRSGAQGLSRLPNDMLLKEWEA